MIVGSESSDPKASSCMSRALDLTWTCQSSSCVSSLSSSISGGSASLLFVVTVGGTLVVTVKGTRRGRVNEKSEALFVVTVG